MTNKNLKWAKLKSVAERHLNFDFCILHFDLKRGFTLLEMIISIGVFSVLVIITIGIMLGVSRAQIQAANNQVLVDNIRFSLELMTKELRTGTGFSLTTACALSGSEIRFTSTDPNLPDRIYFISDTDGDIKRVKLGIGETFGAADCANPAKVTALTAGEVVVERLNFQLRGAASGPNDGQPAVTVSIRVKVKDPKTGQFQSMDLQTTVVRRLRDL